MKKLFIFGLAAVSAVAIAGSAIAAEWSPPGPISLLIAFRAGGGADTQARLVAEALEEKLGWKFIPEEVAGKGGVNMLRALSEKPNDGTAIGMAVTESLGYNLASANAGLAAADFTGLSTTAGFQMAVVARADKGWKDMNEVIAAAKGGQEIKFGVMSQKLGDIAYLMEQAQGVRFNIVSFKGGKAVLNAITAGDVDIGFVAGIQAKGVKAGDLVELASALSTPLAMTPSAPTLADLGVNYNADGYFVFVAPGGMPAEAQAALGDAIASVVTDPDSKVAGIINKAFGGPAVIKGAELDALLQGEYSAAGELMAAVK